ncbi:MAG: nitroreductase family deazaflavin-dependent oxidoreductase [Chloroflexota bacterium]|nr:nitroreductase family deazaflavin-dependent oxidoreductase [Chloroflexota bacterium]
MTEPQYLYLNTIGRKSGSIHEIEIWFVEVDDSYYLIAEGRASADWVQNIIATPAVTIRIGARTMESRAGAGRVVDAAQEPDLAAAVRARMDAKYGWSDGLIVELKPDR